ncbi:hypothetical protein BGW38_010988 [Lunasporangiospora selenospora]|uniref:Uncharacterized protein n=1 Tax=Lunasporangiospora selenospora TaxID=979761 RepID=A0A9P6FWX0_9FUNG|nr:hypothetical protein BGW38_010988 [Lunasporangiospora selenospora]
MKSFRTQGRGKSSIAKVSAPLPVNLPSRRHEKAGHDISLVSSSSSWASPSLVSAAVIGSSASAASSPSTDGASPTLSSSGVVATHAGGPTATGNNGTTHNNSSDSPQLDSLSSSPFQKSTPRAWGIVAASTDQNLDEFPTAAEAAKKFQDLHHYYDGHHTNGQSGGASTNVKRPNAAGTSSGEAMAKTVSALSSDNKWDEVDDEGVDFLNADKIEFADGSVIVAAAVAQTGPAENTDKGDDSRKQLGAAATYHEERVVERGEVDYNRAWPSRGPPSAGPGPSSRHPLPSDAPSRYPPQERAHHSLWQETPSHREGDRRPSTERNQQGYYPGHRRESFSSKEHYPGLPRRDSLGTRESYSGPRRDSSGQRDPHYDRRDSFEHRDRNYSRPRNFSRDREHGRDNDFNPDRRPSHDRPYSSDRYPDRQQRDFQLLTRSKDSFPDLQGPHDPPSAPAHTAGQHYSPGDGRQPSGIGHDPGLSRQLDHRGPDLSQFAPPGAVEFDRPAHVTEEQRGTMKHAAEEARKRREEEEKKFEEARARARARADALAKQADEEKLAKAKVEEAAMAEKLVKEEAEKAAKEKELQQVAEAARLSSMEAKAEDIENKDGGSGWGELSDKAAQGSKDSKWQNIDEDPWKSATGTSTAPANAASNVGPWRRTGTRTIGRQTTGPTGPPEPSAGKDDKPVENLMPVSHVVQRNQGLQGVAAPSAKESESTAKSQAGESETSTATPERGEEKSSQIPATGSEASSKPSSPISEKSGRARNAKNARAERKEQSNPSSPAPWRREELKASAATPSETSEKGSTTESPRLEGEDSPALVNGQAEDRVQDQKEMGARLDVHSVSQPLAESAKITTPVSATPLPTAPAPVLSGSASSAPVPADAGVAGLTMMPATLPAKVTRKAELSKPSVPEFGPENYPAKQVAETKPLKISDISRIHNRLSLQAAGDTSVAQAYCGEAGALKTHASKAGRTGSTTGKRSSLTHSTVATIFPSSVEQAARNRGSMSFMVDSEIDTQTIDSSDMPELQSSQVATPAAQWAENSTAQSYLDTTSDSQDVSARLGATKTWDSTASTSNERGASGSEPHTALPSVDHGNQMYSQGEALPASMPPQSVAMGQGMYIISSSTGGAVNALPQPMWGAGPESNQGGPIAPPGSVVMAAPGGAAGHPVQPYQMVIPPYYPQGFPVNGAPYYYMYPRGPMAPQMAQFPATGVIPHQARMSADAAMGMPRRDTHSGAVSSGGGISAAASSDGLNSAMSHAGGHGNASAAGASNGNNTLTDSGKSDSILGPHHWLPRFSAAGDAPPLQQQLQVSGSFLALGPQASLMAAANINRPPQSRPYGHHHAHHPHPHHAQRPMHQHQQQHGMDGMSAPVSSTSPFQDGGDSSTIDAWGNGPTVSANNRSSAPTATAATSWESRGANLTGGPTGSMQGSNAKSGIEAASTPSRGGMFGPYQSHPGQPFGPQQQHHHHPGGGVGHRGGRGGFHGGPNNASGNGGYHFREIRPHHGRGGGHSGAQFYSQQSVHQQHHQHLQYSNNNGGGVGGGGSEEAKGSEGKTVFAPFSTRAGVAPSNSTKSAATAGES